MTVPAAITPGIASRSSIVHASQDGSFTDSRGHTELEISRLQSSVKAFNTMFQYTTGDLVIQDGITYRNIVANTIGAGFVLNQWEIINSSLPVSDSTSIVKGDGDPGKQLRFEVDNFASAAIRVLTVPDANDTITLNAFAQTLTNKTIDAANNTITNPDGSIFVGNENNVSKDFPTGLEAKADCKLASTGQASLFGVDILDGILARNPDRVLVKNQNIASENGIYIVEDEDPWNRTSDADTSGKVNNGMFTKITEGATNANSAFVLITPNDITLNTTDLVFDKFSLVDIAHLNLANTFTEVNTFTGAVINVVNDLGCAIFSASSFTNLVASTATLITTRSRGTPTTPLALQTNDVMGEWLARGSIGGLGISEGGKINFTATENWSPGNQGTKFQFLNTSNGSSVPTLNFEIDQDGTASFKDNTIQDIASIKLNDDNDSHSYTILGGALGVDVNVTIPDLSGNDTFAMLGAINVFTASNTFQECIVQSSNNANLTIFQSVKSNTGNGPVHDGALSRDVAGVAADVEDGDRLWKLNVRGFQSGFKDTASMVWNVDGNWTTSNFGSSLTISTTPTGTITPLANIIIKNKVISFESNDLTNVVVQSPTIVTPTIQSTTDAIATMTVKSTTTNSGTTQLHVGDRDPNGVVSADGGAEYLRDSGAISNRFLNRGAAAGTDWDTYSTNPPNVIEIKNSADFEDLAVSNVITISANTTLVIKGSILTQSRIVVDPFITLHITALDINTANIIYTGTGTFITATLFASVRIFSAIALISGFTGTFMSFSGGGTLNIDTASIIGWDELGTFNDGLFLNANINYINTTSGWIITNPIGVSAISVGVIATTDLLNDSLYTVNSNNPGSGFRFTRVVSIGLSPTGSLLDLSTRLNNNTTATVDFCEVSPGTGGDLFKQPTSPPASITSVADSSPLAGDVDGAANNGTGGTTISSTTTYFNDEEVTITGTASGQYDGTFQIFNVDAGVSFDIITPFGTDSIIGSIASTRIAMTLLGGHGVTIGMSIKVIDTQLYNAFYTVLNVVSDVITLNAVFIADDSGTIERIVSLDETDPRVDAKDNPGVSDSRTIAFGNVNTNTIFTNTVSGTYVPIDVSTFKLNQISERFKLINSTLGIWRYIGREDFKGFLTGSLTAENAPASNVTYRFAMSTNSAVPNFAAANFIPIEVKGVKVNVALEFSVLLKKNETIQVMVAQQSGVVVNLKISDFIFGIK